MSCIVAAAGGTNRSNSSSEAACSETTAPVPLSSPATPSSDFSSQHGREGRSSACSQPLPPPHAVPYSQQAPRSGVARLGPRPERVPTASFEGNSYKEQWSCLHYLQGALKNRFPQPHANKRTTACGHRSGHTSTT